MKKKLVFSLENINIKKDENLLIGSEWVFELNKKNLNNLNYQIFYSQSPQKKQRVKNTIDSSNIYEKIMEDLYRSLNLIHKVNLNLKAWKIVLGPWVRRFVDLCYQRDYLIREIMSSNSIDKIYGIKSDLYPLYSKDTVTIHPFSRDILWNNIILYKILKFYNFQNIQLDFQEITHGFEDYNMNAEHLSKDGYKISSFKKIIFSIFNYFRFFQKKNDALIIGSGLPFIYEKLFELLFFQVPKNYKIIEIDNLEYDPIKRSELKFNLVKDNKQNNVEGFIRSFLHEFLPTCFIENFKKIYNECENYYPKNPKFILTGLNQEYDEIFKFYTAKKVNMGTPYFIMQHGNTYFVEDYILNRVEYQTAIKFLTFGYAKKSFCEPFGNIKTIKASYNYKKDGKLNILAWPMIGLHYPFDRNIEFLRSFKLIQDFKKKICPEIDKLILLRLHPNFNTKRGTWYKNTFLKDFKNSQLDFGKIDYSKFLREGRINLIFYDGTGILENFHFNIPTVVIWCDSSERLYDHVDDEFIEKYNYLRETGILFDDLNKLINHLLKYWNNIDEWWFSQKTQDSIKKFNQDFNNKINFFSLFKLKKIIDKNIT